jgi:putative transposase
MGTKVVDEVAGSGDMDQAVSRLPDAVQVALGGIAEAAREGLLALSVTTGLAVLAEMMETERTGLCGPIHDKNPDRAAVRGGTTPTSVVLGGRRVPIRRPRVRRIDGSGEVELETFCAVNDSDLLGAVTMERMLAGLATRRYTAANEPVGEKVEAGCRSVSKSSVSRRFVTGTRKALEELLSRDLGGLEVAVLMIDGVEFAGSCCVVAMVITTDGTKVPVGLRQGDTENATVVKALLADVVDRGLDASGGVLVVIDGAKALSSAVKSVFGDLALIARCQLHKRRNVADHLPKSEQARIDKRLQAAFNHPDPDQGLANARALASEVERSWPDAAGSIREGLSEMFTVRCLGVEGTLLRTLMSTNPIESMISIARDTSGNVKRWRDEGDMRRRWCAAGMLAAEKQFRRIKGYRQMPALVAALRRHAASVTPLSDTERIEVAA